MFGKIVFQFALFALSIGALLFLPAGTLNYPAAWAFLAIMTGGGILISVWLARHDPRLLRERMSAPIQREQKGWDRLFIAFLFVTFSGWLAFCAWDAARQGFAAPRWAQALGAVFVALYLVGAWLTFRENSFAAPVVKLQEGQKVIDTGPYAIVRHPMYAAALLLFIGAPLLLGSVSGLVGSAVLIAAIAWRAVQEEQELRTGLAGYDSYAARVRYRFIPLVW